MKTAILAGALAAATFAAAPQASAANVDFALKLAGPNGVVQIASPGHRNKGHRSKGHRNKYRGYKSHDPRWRGHGPRWRGYGHRYRPWRRDFRRYCMGPRQLRWFLQRHGWYGYRVAKMTPGIAVVYSHRYGARYRIKIDRCAHRIIRVSRKGGFY